MHTYIGGDYEPDEADAAVEPVRYRELFTRRYRSRTIFACTFWLCQVFPYFAIGPSCRPSATLSGWARACEVRASGVGLAAAISRAGAALSTFVLPLVLDASGVGGTMLLLAAVVAAGLVLSVFLAPETRHLSLAEAAGTAVRQPADAPDGAR